MENHTENIIKKSKKSLRYILIFIGITIISVFKLLITSNLNDLRNVASSLGELVGSVLFGVVFIFGITALIVFIFKTKKSKTMFILGLIYLLLNIVVIFNSTTEYMNQAVKTELAEQKIHRIITSMINGEILKKEDISYEKYGNATDIVKFNQDLYIELQTLMINYETNLPDIDLNELLSNQTIGNHNEITNARIKIDTALNNIDKFCLDVNQLFNKYIKRIETVDKSNEYTDGFILGFLESSKKFPQNLTAQQVKTKEVYISLDNLLAFLQDHEKEYTIVDSELHFQDNEDVTQYNILVDKLNNSIDELNKLAYNNQTKLEEKLDSFK